MYKKAKRVGSNEEIIKEFKEVRKKMKHEIFN
jgi:hypothetical protein